MIQVTSNQEDLRRKRFVGGLGNSWTVVLCSRAIAVANLAIPENVPPCPVKYHTLIEYRHEVAASVVVLRPVSESFSGS
ncbi:hypothetical protein EVAR_39856_1 [Eumeta japonica]|uniref:Uncharacterized protein n=1 Tax=Eumeta variegata TaxID=151549 RepID=A0A4C1WT08_EUMVA|nr:hypothetical protein EVAR_39856_1 [Eumeta japonica]